MDLAYAAADVIISRAGALSVSELCLVGKPVLFIPSPNVSEDHQTKNAQTLVEQDAGYLLAQNELVNGGLTPLLEICLAQPNMLVAMGNKARALAKLDAVQRVTHCCQLLVEKAQ